MQKNRGILFAGLLIALLVCGVVSADTITNAGGSVYSDEITLRVNGVTDTSAPQNHVYRGDIIRLSGVAPNTDMVYLSVVGGEITALNGEKLSSCTPSIPGDPSTYDTASVNPIDHTWGYTWNTENKEICITKKWMPQAYWLLLSKDPQRHSGKNEYSIVLKIPPGGLPTTPQMTYAIMNTPPISYTPTPTQTVNLTPDLLGKLNALNQSLAQQNGTLNDQGILIDSLNSTIVTQETVLSRHLSSTPTDTPNYAATIAALESQVAQQGNWIDQIMRFLGLR